MILLDEQQKLEKFRYTDIVLLLGRGVKSKTFLNFHFLPPILMGEKKKLHFCHLGRYNSHTYTLRTAI